MLVRFERNTIVRKKDAQNTKHFFNQKMTPEENKTIYKKNAR